MLGRAVNLYFITKYKNISTRKPKYRRAVMRIKEFILYGLSKPPERIAGSGSRLPLAKRKYPRYEIVECPTFL